MRPRTDGRLGYWLACLTALALVLLIVPRSPASAANPTVLNGRISFLTDINGSPRLGTSRLDGSDVRISRLTGSTDFFGVGSTPQWSADGGSLLFLTMSGSGVSHVRTLRVDGGGLEDHGSLVGVLGGLIWTPEGNIGWVTQEGLWEAPLDTLGAAVLVAPGLQGWQLRYSPDGTQIAFSRWLSDDGQYHIWTAARDGTDQVQVTSGTPGQFSPDWSPDGTRVAYRFGEFGDGGSIQVHTMLATGSDDVTLTSAGRNYEPVWSPDGSKIAFGSGRGDGVWVMNADGTDQHRETTGRRDYIDWQPQYADLSMSRTHVVYGTEVAVQAGTPSGQAGGDLTVYRVAAGSDALRQIFQGVPDSDGRVTLTIRPNTTATYLARWSGDGVSLGGWSDTASTTVQVKLSGKTVGGYATQNGVRLYHYAKACQSGTGCPTTSFTLGPAHPDEKLWVTVQLLVNGSWKTTLEKRFPLYQGRVTTIHWTYSDRTIVGRTYRVGAEFLDDEDHLGNSSPWVRFRVTG